MTTPTPIGYQDWLRPRTIPDQMLYNTTWTSTGFTQLSTVYVGSVDTVLVTLSVTGANPARLTLDWITGGSTQGTLVFDDNLVAGQGGLVTKAFRPKGSYLELHITSAGNTDGAISVSTATDWPQVATLQSDILQINKRLAGIGAGATVTDTALNCRPGRVYCRMTCNSANFSQDLQHLDYAGTVTPLVHTNATLGQVDTQLWVPAGIIRIQTVNVAGVAANYDATLICEAIY